MTPFEAWMGEKPNVERLVVLCMPMYLKMSEESLSQKLESAFFWVMVSRPRDTVCMIQNRFPQSGCCVQ